MNANEKIEDDFLIDAIRLDKLKRNTLGKILRLLKESDRDIIEQIRASGLTEFQARRINALSNDIRAALLAVYAAIESEAGEASLTALEAAINEGARRLDTVAGVTWTQKPSIDVIYSAAMARPYQGKLMREHYRDLPDTLSLLIRSQIRIGFQNGETVTQVEARVRKLLKGRQVNFNRTLINTTLAHYSGFAQRKLYERNASNLVGVKWNATLDTKTTPFCVKNGGKIFDVDKVPVYPNHWNERTVLTPIVKGADQLNFDVPNRTQASLDGQVPADLTNIQWLERQSFSRQVEALGRMRAEIVRDTDLTIADLFTSKGEFYTIAELRRMANIAA